MPRGNDSRRERLCVHFAAIKSTIGATINWIIDWKGWSRMPMVFIATRFVSIIDSLIHHAQSYPYFM